MSEKTCPTIGGQTLEKLKKQAVFIPLLSDKSRKNKKNI
jgi:hypothetical protein